MDDLLLLHVLERLQDLNSKPPYEIHREFVCLTEIIEIDCEELKYNADMLSEDEPILNSYDVVLVFWVVVLEML